MKNINIKNSLNKRKFNKGEICHIKPGYYYVWATWCLEKGLPQYQRPIYVNENHSCKFVKNSPDGPSFKILEIPSGEQIEVLTTFIK